MDTITIFTNFSPNSGDSYSYFPDGNSKDFNQKLLQKYISSVSLSQPPIILNGSTFKIYSGYIEVADNNIRYYDATYIAIEHNNYITFYYVDSIEFVSAGVRLYIRIDYWGTYIGRARIVNMEVTKTNLKLGGLSVPTLYTTDIIPINNAANDYFIGIGELLTADDVRIIAVINLQEESSVDTSITNINVFGFDPKQFTTGAIKSAVISECIEGVRNIYSLANSNLKATVTKVYIISKTIYDITFTAGAGFNTVVYGEKKLIQSQNLSSYTSQVIEKQFNIFNGEAGYTVPDGYQTITALGCEMYAGVKYDGLKLPEFVGEYTVKVRFSLSPDSLKVIMVNHAEERDITSNFELPIVANSGTLTPLETMGKSLGLIANIAGGAFQIAAGGAGIISGTAQIGTALTNINNHSNGTYIPAGNGYVTFANIVKSNDIGASSDRYLFYLRVKGSANNVIYVHSQADKRIATMGADCLYLIYFNDLKGVIKDYPYLLYNTDGVRIIRGTAEISQIPQQAIDAISTKLKEGVKLLLVS